MLSGPNIIEEARKAAPKRLRKVAASAASLADHPDFRRLMAFVDGYCAVDELSFAPMAGATAIDPIYAALREGAKIPSSIIRALAVEGAGMKTATEEGDGVEVKIP